MEIMHQYSVLLHGNDFTLHYCSGFHQREQGEMELELCRTAKDKDKAETEVEGLYYNCIISKF